ncbi:hypothetical protein EB118_01490 [bacterium]|nr:hypothetical protein [bacterium]NBX98549.1 hypothetical protein [bacterium]NDC93817.1 hypothetical protein [bacterium]NDD83607.1 hypothetical protein [bacterium]NDG28763.1 hypothetical protein [bacterium]
MKRVTIIAALVLVMYPFSVFAQSSSTSYQVNESTFNSGGNIDTNSASYNARGGAGDLGVGESSSVNYVAFGGSITPDQEYLEMGLTSSNADLGLITPSTTGIGVTTFYVRAYTNGSYVVRSTNQPPVNGSYVWNAMATAGASIAGTEQYGINLTANTSPTNSTYPAGAGSNPTQTPSTTFANGQAATGYNTPNIYKYVVGDTIATSGGGRAWGRTDYSLTIIANIGGLTPGGAFSVDQDLVVVATY